jgi:hypothetical protein
MATNNRGRNGRNNNPEGRNQYSGVIGTARGNPLSAAVAVGGAVAAGVFLWSRRNQISDQIGNLTEQVNGWRESAQPGTGSSSENTHSDTGSMSGGRTQAQIAEEALTLKQTGENA